MKDVVLPDTLRDFEDADKARQWIYSNALESIQKRFPVEDDNYSLSLLNPHYDGPQEFPLSKQRDAIVKMRSLHVPIKGTWQLKHKPSGSILDQRDDTIIQIPYLTSRGTFIRNGTEYSGSSQSRLKAGAYARMTNSGIPEVFYNVKPGTGKNFRISMEPSTGVFKLNIAQASIPLYPVLKAIGINDEQIIKSWGPELAHANASIRGKDAVAKLYKQMAGFTAVHNNEVDQISYIKDSLTKYGLDPWVITRNLGIENASNITPDVLLRSTNKILNMAKGEEEPDDRDAPVYSNVLSYEDFIKDRIDSDAGKLTKSLFHKIKRDKTLKRIPYAALNPYVDGYLMGSRLTMPLEETNPLHLLEQQIRINKLGEGGISSAEAVTDAARNVNTGQLGFIDPVSGPECYSDDTEIFTSTGWISVTKIDEDTLFACNIDGVLEFHKASRIIKAKYSGPMYGVKTKFIDYLVTPNHNCWVRPIDQGLKYRFERADTVFGRQRNFITTHAAYEPAMAIESFTLPIPASKRHKEGYGREAIQLPQVSASLWAEFLGYYISEGCLNRGKRWGIKGIKISQDKQMHPDKYNKMDECLAKFNITYGKYDDGFSISRRQLGLYLEQFGTSHYKYLPDYVFQFSAQNRQILLDALLLGDGRTTGSHLAYCTCSKRLADDVERLAISLGYSTNRHVELDNRYDPEFAMYIVAIHKYAERTIQDRTLHTKTTYDGMVYCATVPGNLLYVKRGYGIGHWSGNSSSVGIDVRAAYKTYKGRDKQIYAEFRDRSGKLRLLKPEDVDDKTVAFPNQDLTDDNAEISAVRRGKIVNVPASEVDYQVPTFAHMMSHGANLNLMPTGISPSRLFYMAKYWSQFMPQVKGEVPLVATLMPDNKDMTFSEYYGRKVGTLPAPVDGEVVKVDDNNVVIMDQEGKKHNVEMVKDFPYNRLSVCGDTPVLIKNEGEISRICIKDYKKRKYDEVLSYDPITKKSAWKRISKFIKHENTKKLLRVSFLSGRHVDITADHSLMTLNHDLELVPIYPRDCIINSTRCPIVFGNICGTADWSYEDGILDGLYLSEGCTSNVQKGMCSIAVEPVDRINYIRDLLVGLGEKPNNNRKSKVSWTDHARYVRWKTDFGRLAHGKYIASHVFSRGIVYLTGLIAGYMAGDGCLHSDTNNAIQLEASTVSRQLRDGLVSILNLLGIFTMLKGPSSNGGGNHREIYKFRVRSSDIHKLAIWFAYPDRQAKLESLTKKIYRASSFDLMPVVRAARKLVYNSYPGRVIHFIYKSATAGIISKHRLLNCNGIPGLWAKSDILWDTISDIVPIEHQQYVYDFSVADSECFATADGLLVHNTSISYSPNVKVGDVVTKGAMVANSNFTDAKTGALNMGVNLRAAIMTAGGESNEDAHYISESAAKKLATSRLYRYDETAKHGTQIDKNRYAALFSDKFTKDQLNKIGPDGLVKPGTILNKGDPIILATGPKLLSPEDYKLGKLHKALRSTVTNKAQTWDHDYPGHVIDANMAGKTALINIKAEAPVQVGDKLVTMNSLKGITNKVIRDEDMPQNSVTGEPYEILINPMGILSRVAPSQIAELQLAKIAKKTGKQLRIPQDPPPEGWNVWTLNQLKEHGLKESSTVFDPKTKKYIPNIGDGYAYMSAFHHLAEKKTSDRGAGVGSYTADEMPAHGGFAGGGAKRFGGLDRMAALSAGATEVIRDVVNIRGAKNEDYWKMLKLGHRLPEPKVPFVYDKFINLLKASGINIRDKGSTMELMPMTDNEISKLSKGDITSSRMLDRNFEPVTGGLFDVGKTGGITGSQWSTIPLVEPMPNPVFEEPIRRLLGLRQSDLYDVISGKQQINGKTGGKAIREALSNVNIDEEIKKHKELVTRLRGSNRDNSVKILGYLSTLKRQGNSPADWVINKVPVLPPVFRPINQMGDVVIQADINELYRDILETNNNIKDITKELSSEGAADEKATLYDAIKATYGIGDPITREGKAKKLKGSLRQIIGTSPKYGLVQSKLLAKPVDTVGRAVIAPDPNMGIDSIGIPEDLAWTVYGPFIMRRLSRHGVPAHKSLELIKNRDKIAADALNEEMQVRPVIADRAPVWHKFNLMAYYPHIVKDKVIRVSPLVVRAFSGDHDGDQMNFHVPVSDKAVEQAISKMLPSKNLISVTDLESPMFTPGQEMALGLYTLTKDSNKKGVKVFRTKEEAKQAYRDGRLGVNDPIEIAG